MTQGGNRPGRDSEPHPAGSCGRESNGLTWAVDAAEVREGGRGQSAGVAGGVDDIEGDLRIGDKIRIVGVPGEGIPDYTIHRDTIRVYKKLIDRKRPVRI